MEEFLKTLNIYDFATFRDACIKECNITPQAWSTWRTGKVVISEKYHDIINKVASDLFGRVVFDD